MAFPCPVKTYHSDTYPAINPSLPHLSTKGKNVVVSGGGSGIGAAIVRSLATSGSTSITILGRREKNLLETKEAINKDIPDTTIYTIVADIASKESTLAAFDTIKSNVGTVDILIANAGYYSDHATIEGADLDEWFKAFEINVKGNFNLVKAFLPLATENAAVINVSAAMTHVEYFPLSSAYHSSKLAAIKIFDYIHNEHPELFVLNVHPGALRTAMAAKAISESKLPYDEMGLPGDFVVWAVSPDAKFLNGKFVWAHWDVDELKAMSKEIVESDKFTIGLLGWGSQGSSIRDKF